MAPIDFKPYVELISSEVSLLSEAVKEKGAKRFGRVMAVAGIMVFASYYMVLMPAARKSATLSAEIARAKSLSESGAQYKSLRDQLAQSYALLPSVSQRGQWLSNSVRDSLSVGGLITNDFKPVRENELNGLIFQSSSVSVQLRFSEFFDWLLRLESAKPMMHLEMMELVKKEEAGYNAASFDVGTIIPMKEYR